MRSRYLRKRMIKAVCAAIYLIGTSLLINYFFSNWIYDDPFITYRYAANLRHGLGFVYNSGERVLSTTTPLFTFLLALFGNLWSDLPQLAKVIGAFSLAWGGVCLWDLGNTWKSPMAGWAGLLLYPAFPLLHRTLGSETPLYLAFCLSAFAFYSRQRYSLTAVCLALAVLTRPDGILLAFVLALHFFVQIRRPIPWMALALFLGMTIPWFVFAWIYFGSPLPATLAVKQQQGIMAISQLFSPGLFSLLGGYPLWPYLLEAGLAAVGLIFMFLRARQWGLLTAWIMLYFLMYSMLGVTAYFWYYAPLVPGLIVLIGLGITGIRGAFISSRTPFYYFAAISLLIALSASQAVPVPLNNRSIIYGLVGEWLRGHTPPNASVGTLEVGIIGFHSQRRMIDFAGLIQPEVGGQFTQYATYEDSALWAAERYHPDYLALFEGDLPRFEHGYIAQHCAMIKRFPQQAYVYSSRMTVYVCR